MAHWSTQTAVREYKLGSNGELTVVERLASLLETGQYADVTIRVGEGDDVVTFKAHRLLLATASQPLNNLVNSNIINGPGESATLRLTDVDPEAFQHILKFIYTDDIEINGAGESISLLKAGKKWGLQNLTKKTAQYLEDFLDDYKPNSEERKNDLCELTIISEEFGLDLNTKCWDVLLKNVNEVVPCQSFLNMPKHMVKRLLTHPDFQFKDQLVLFEAIRDWGMNQVLQQNLSVNSLQGLIGEFLQLIDFRAIKDVDFLDTILPSECLGKSELIAFFMTRGLAIPRDLVYSNNKDDDSKYPYEKSGRYKRGYKLPNQEIYKEHELRFRVDKKLRLLGVGFGFLFSNTDMGITVHCQGPFETRQWSDIIQTYCRVSWEKMKTADVRLMFSEPVIIEPNHSYKVLVRVSRMSAGSTDVDLWGGASGLSRLNIKGGEISFLKSAVDSDKEVKDSDTENKPGMITDLIYEMIDETSPTTPSSPSTISSLKTKPKHDPVAITPMAKKKPEESFTSRSSAISNAVGSHDENPQTATRSHVNTLADTNSQMGGTSASSYSFRRNVPSSRIEISPVPSPPEPRRKKSYADEASSYYLVTKPSSIRGSDAVPSFLRPRQPSVEKSKPFWQIPSRTGLNSSVVRPFKQRESSTQRESSITKENNPTLRRPSKESSKVFDDSPLSKYNYGISSFRSKFESNRGNDRLSYGRSCDSSSSTHLSSSKFRPSSGLSSNISESRYGTTLQPSRYTSSTSDSRYGLSSNSGVKTSSTDQIPGSRFTSGTTESCRGRSVTSGTNPTLNTTDKLTSSRFTSGASSSNTLNRLRKEPSPSPARISASSSAYKYSSPYSQTTGKETGMMSSSGLLGRSGFSTSGTSSSTGKGSRYGTGTLSTSTKSNLSGDISSRYGSGASNTLNNSTSLGGSKRYEPSTAGSISTSSSLGHTRYGSSSLANNTNIGSSVTSLGSRLSSNPSTPSYLSSGRFGTSSPFGSSYNSTITNRFGSSIYKR